jgi:large subunit ribosomal protein L25
MGPGYPRFGAARPRFATIDAALMASDTSSLSLTPRAPEGSRSARRLRREGFVPGVLYGGDGEPQHFAVDGRLLRNTLSHSGAILQVSLDGAADTPVLVKDLQRHPVRGEAVHVDLLRVNMNETIHTTVAVELVGGDDSPGVSEGGVLSQETREVNIEALPGDIPDVIQHDVSAMHINETLTLDSISAPAGVTFLDDAETVIASITPPTAEPVDEDIETETTVIGDAAVDSAQAQAQAEGDTADEAEQKADAADAS